MKALEYLQENVDQSNIPREWYELEIAEMMEEYALYAQQQPSEDDEIKVGEIVLWHFDDNTRSRFVEVKAVNYTDKSKTLGVWLGGGWIRFDELARTTDPRR